MRLLQLLPAGARLLLIPSAPLAPWRSAVVIPARNEAQRIVACLEALRCQWSVTGRTALGDFVTVLVINGSTDASVQEVYRWHLSHPEMPLLLVDVDFPVDLAHVGSARGLGFDLAIDLLRQHGQGQRMLFSTDADTRLGASCLAEAYRWLERGADAVGAHIRTSEPDTSRIGAVVNAYRNISREIRQQYYPSPLAQEAQHGDFGGAGFGVSLDAYQKAGGLPRLSFDEDQGMRRRLLDNGAAVLYPSNVAVYTSTRLDGRAVWGMAQQLAVWERDYEHNRWPMAPTASGLVWKYALKAQLRDGRRPGAYFDRSGHLASLWNGVEHNAPFEARWSRFWQDASTRQHRDALFPLLSLPLALRSLQQHARPQEASLLSKAA